MCALFKVTFFAYQLSAFFNSPTFSSNQNLSTITGADELNCSSNLPMAIIITVLQGHSSGDIMAIGWYLCLLASVDRFVKVEDRLGAIGTYLYFDINKSQFV